jgi:hypothetical protein
LDYFGESGRNSNLLTADVQELQTADHVPGIGNMVAALAALDARDHPGTAEALVVAAATGRVNMLGGSLTEAEMWAVLTVAGWPEELLAEALTVAYCESRYRPGAVGDGGNSLGLFQLNGMWFGYAGEDRSQWADPVVNARTAWATYQYDIGRGYVPWKQWSCRKVLP